MATIRTVTSCETHVHFTNKETDAWRDQIIYLPEYKCQDQNAGFLTLVLLVTVSTALARPVYFFTRKNLYETSEKPEEYPCPKSEVFSFLTEK